MKPPRIVPGRGPLRPQSPPAPAPVAPPPPRRVVPGRPPTPKPDDDLLKAAAVIAAVYKAAKEAFRSGNDEAEARRLLSAFDDEILAEELLAVIKRKGSTEGPAT